MENLLIDVWQEKIDDIRGPRKNSHIYIAHSMKEAGLDMEWPEDRSKIENLTKKYKTEKNIIGPSGGAPSGWQLNSFLGSFRINNVDQNTLDNHNIDEYFLESVEVDPNGSNCASAPPTKRAKQDAQTELLSIARERLDIQKAQQKTNDTRTEILQQMASSNDTFQSELLQFLRESKANNN
ncbi:uncharacterized protein LOC111080119 [Drosophila obscura]|uniref:uncharacterized protein LOC111080119 n=1 Tax=Drosophila obscura TaxID=7282 RepID=UPI001BB113AE|nr:uncharacterized protein LOC111080119 [Drosophila obscura]